MPTSIKRRLKKRLCYRAARMIRPVIVAYADLFLAEEDSGPEMPRYDTSSTISGHFEVAANAEHTTPVTFGFSSMRRAHEGHRAEQAAPRAPRWPPGV